MHSLKQGLLCYFCGNCMNGKEILIFVYIMFAEKVLLKNVTSFITLHFSFGLQVVYCDVV